jgi:transcriptional regulator with XRE-family HTH domain
MTHVGDDEDGVERFMLILLARRERGVTLQAIGDDLAVSHEAVRRWLTGERRPSRQTVRLAERVWRGEGEWPL